MIRQFEHFALRCTLALTSFLTFLPALLHSQNVSSFPEALLEVPLADRQSYVDRFLLRYPANPIFTSDSVVILLYAGTAASVTCAGDANGWSPGIDTLSNIPGTSLWFGTFTYEPDARFDYKFVIDGSSWILDPRNPRRSFGGFGENSELRMPGYADHPELVRRLHTPRGSLHDTVVTGMRIGNSRHISIYIPAGYDEVEEELGTVVVHDGLEFVEIAGMPTVLDNLIADGSIPPVIAVFVPPIDRTSEYAGERMDIFAAFIVDDILPVLRARYRISSDPARSVVMGASNGGNISLYMAMTYPEIFGNVVAFSSNVLPSIAARYAESPRLPVRIYLDLGTYDIVQLIPKVRSLRRVLLQQGYDHRYAEFHDGHSWANWRSHLDDALLFVLN